jgi:uncharacterized protein
MKSLKLLSLIVLVINMNSVNAQIKENSLLWEVSGNGLESPSYIFGILKFIPTEDYYFPESADTKLSECKVLSLETKFDHHAKHELNKAAHLADHQSIEDHLTDDEFEILKKIFNDQLSISENKFNLMYKKFKPVMLSTTMTRLSLGENISYYENELLSLANEKGMQVVELETIEKEIEAFEKLPLDVQVIALKHTLKNFETQLADYNALVESYKVGNLHKTFDYTLHPIENNKDFEQHFIFDRNKEWVVKMDDYMKEASTFFAIGASHLSESQGILELLAAKGYTIKPVK